MKIADEWKLKWFEPGRTPPLEIAAPSYIDHFWMSASVPGDVHSELLSKRLIRDPFVGHNDLDCRWVEEKEWWYRTVFNWEEEFSDQDDWELIFEGLDTFATIYINGKEIGSSANMLVEHSFNITKQIKKGNNVIAVKIDPVHLHVAHKEQSYWCSYGKERIWTRKAAMNFGWDWGPRLVTAGIWKDVKLIKRSKAQLNGVFAKTVRLAPEAASVEVEAEVKQLFKNKESLTLSVELRSGDEVFSAEAPVIHSRAAARIEVADPKLWWTHDLGDPHLYKFVAELKDENGSVLDEHAQDFGIREVRVEQKHENGENLFTFNLNGVRLFAKGANWIPVHSFIGSAEDSRYTKLLQLAKDTHMNMMRVWGGGIYEKGIFYRECDRLGILVWQDFMFANALYPDYNQDFMANVRDEIIKVVKRLRNYTCLALWCGNNEIDWIYDRKHSDGEITTPFYGESIYHELIPQVLEEYDPTRLFWPSSPFGSVGDHDLDDETVGDRHNWVVWHGNVEPRKKGEPVVQDISLQGVSFKQYKKDFTLFSSEFGMHASSNRYTLAKYIPEGEFYWKSQEMSYRNKDHFHEKGILLMEGFTGVPSDIEEYMNYSMLAQAEGLKYGIEHYRRRKPFTSGALIWQLNDCWPGTSWSMVDYELLPKASYYYAKKFFAPVLATIDHDPGTPLKVTMINDQLQEVKDTVIIEALTFEGELLFSDRLDFEMDGNCVQYLAAFTEEEVLRGKEASEVVLRLTSVKGTFPENFYYLRDFKNISYPKANLEIERNDQESTITIMSDKLARFVKLDLLQEEVVCSDNFFDMLPGERKTIYLKSLNEKRINLDYLQVSTVNSGKTFTSVPVSAKY
ncbi:beta-mannosidase [Bacillus sp. OV194]|nr:beta-mannosidase [Bacillus sp. OV194]